MRRSKGPRRAARRIDWLWYTWVGPVALLAGLVFAIWWVALEVAR